MYKGDDGAIAHVWRFGAGAAVLKVAEGGGIVGDGARGVGVTCSLHRWVHVRCVEKLIFELSERYRRGMAVVMRWR